nr:TauD/TfdA family dioxygenase [Rhodospirillales bacterium]
MNDFRTFKTARREPAVVGEPIVDPAGWNPEDLTSNEDWIYHLSDQDIGDLTAGVEAIRAGGKGIVDMKHGDFQAGAFAETLKDIRHELLDGRGLVMLRGLPVDAMGVEASAMAYFGIGTHLGHPLRQNAQGHVLGHVKDLGGDYSDPNTRGYLTKAEMKFHADHSDYVGLLCLKQGKSGGESRVASSITLYNRILEQRPDLVRELCNDWHWTKHQQTNSADELPYFTQPIFMFEQGVFSAHGLSSYVIKAQGLPGVPDFTPAQKEAIELYRATVEECATDILFQAGDIQLLHNHVLLHSRRSFEDFPEPERKRHLMRLWLRDPEGRTLPGYMREGLFGAGVELDGVAASAPLDVEAA